MRLESSLAQEEGYGYYITEADYYLSVAVAAPSLRNSSKLYKLDGGKTSIVESVDKVDLSYRSLPRAAEQKNVRLVGSENGHRKFYLQAADFGSSDLFP